MKLPRFTLWLVVAFILGYAAHAALAAVQHRRYQSRLESIYQNVLPVGDDFEKVSAALKAVGFNLQYNSYTHRYFMGLPADFGDRLELNVEVDENRRIKNVSVVTVFLR